LDVTVEESQSALHGLGDGNPLADITLGHPAHPGRGEALLHQPWLEVYEKVAGEMDTKIAEFDAALEKDMAKFVELAP
jgi:hypothetical protein